MSSLAKILLSLSLVFASSCCWPDSEQPVRPKNVLGWKESTAGGVRSICILVLNKGESSDNGEIGVKVVDIIPADPCAHRGTFHGSRRVVLRFFRPSDQKVLYEDTFTEGSGTLDSPHHCGSDVAGVTAIHINAINTAEGWVYFDLRNRNLLKEKN